MKMTGLAAGTLLAAAAFAFPATSQAQVRAGDVFGARDSRDSRVLRDRGFGFDETYRIGHEKGFEDGQKRGAKDRSKGDVYSLSRDKKYRQGDAGYKKSYGPRQDYIAGYRDGYEQAYRRGFRTGDQARRRGGRAGVLGRGRDRDREREDPYEYGRDGRYGRGDRDGRDDRWGTDPYERDGRWEDDREDDDDGLFGRDRRDRDDDDFDDDVIYEEESPGRW